MAEEIEEISSPADEPREIKEEGKTTDTEILELKASLSSQEEANRQLQNYIDAVILNIMEKNPELLEVSNKN